MLIETIPLQHVRYFQRQFDRDIISKRLTLEEFCKLIQVTPVLGNNLFHIISLNDVKLIFRKVSSQHFQTREYYRNQQNSRRVSSSNSSPLMDFK